MKDLKYQTFQVKRLPLRPVTGLPIFSRVGNIMLNSAIKAYSHMLSGEASTTGELFDVEKKAHFDERVTIYRRSAN